MNLRVRNGNQGSAQVRMIWLAVAGLLAVVLAYRTYTHRPAVSAQIEAAAGPAGKSVAAVAAAAATPSAVVPAAGDALRVQPDEVLATVNGRQIKARDAIPFGGTNQEMEISRRDLTFYLHRAVDRELIFEAAGKQGIVLDESQNRQIANMQAMRNQREPGGVARLNDDPAGRRLEALDAEAFMLQTAIMAAHGTSPNVTEGQVQAYYQQHQPEFESLPGGADANGRAWQQVAFQIRSQLAASTRANYDSELAAYMHQMESEAEVVLNSP